MQTACRHRGQRAGGHNTGRMCTGRDTTEGSWGYCLCALYGVAILHFVQICTIVPFGVKGAVGPTHVGGAPWAHG